jgi:murein DD-endopeptidase MepM/ murein hydrolase activator NlpD
MRKDPFTGKPEFHDGIDIAAKAGTPIYPLQSGTVKYSGWKSGHGRVVIVSHGDGSETLYAHASKTLVKSGDEVAKETIIAEVGSTGKSTGPHLHFEMRRAGKSINPIPLIRDDSLHVAKAL